MTKELRQYSLATAETLRRKKPSVQHNHLVVAADDRRDQLQYTQEALDGLPIGVEPAHTLAELIILALEGNAGQPANTLFLDDNYTTQLERWTITKDLALELAQKFHTPLDHILAINRLHNSTDLDCDVKLLECYYYIDSISIALLLRLLGFQGQIFVLTSDPPSADRIQKITAKFQQLVPETQVPILINGISMKKPFNPSGNGRVIHIARETQTSPDGTLEWVIEKLIKAELYTALAVLLKVDAPTSTDV